MRNEQLVLGSAVLAAMGLGVYAIVEANKSSKGATGSNNPSTTNPTVIPTFTPTVTPAVTPSNIILTQTSSLYVAPALIDGTQYLVAGAVAASDATSTGAATLKAYFAQNGWTNVSQIAMLSPSTVIATWAAAPALQALAATWPSQSGFYLVATYHSGAAAPNGIYAVPYASFTSSNGTQSLM